MLARTASRLARIVPSSGARRRTASQSSARTATRCGSTKSEAQAVAEHAGKLLCLATDETTRKRIGDTIATAKRGASLPSAEDVARRIGVGLDPASTGISTGEAWHAWLTGKKRLRASSAERLEIAGRHGILPVLADVPLERLNGAHVAEVFTRIERLNAELTAKQGGSRSFVRLDGNVRTRPRHVGIASQHRPPPGMIRSARCSASCCCIARGG